MKKFVLTICAITLLGAGGPARVADPGAGEIRIGVLSVRSKEECMAEWGGLAGYLKRHLPDKTFRIIPLEYLEIRNEVNRGELDFVLTNPVIYIEFETVNEARRIATLMRGKKSFPGAYYGSVIFRRADRTDITRLADLSGRRLAAVDRDSLGGWLIAAGEFRDAGLNPFEDFARLEFYENHDEVVDLVLAGKADAGIVKTGIIEKLVRDGRLGADELFSFEKEEYRYLDLPFVTSTALYPEWPFAKLKHIDDATARRVAVALLSAAEAKDRAEGAVNWTIPLNYQPVKELMMKLGVGPWERAERLAVGEIVRRFWPWTLGTVLLLTCAAVVVVYVFRLNARLRQITRKLNDELVRKGKVEVELNASREELANLAAHLQTVRDDECSRIAREVHDELGQSLTAIKMDLAMLRRKLDAPSAAASERIESMNCLLDATIRTVKRIATELRPRMLEDLGLAATIEWQIEEFQWHTGIECEADIDHSVETIDRDRAVALFRIFQEAITNVARHSRASRMNVTLGVADRRIVLEVGDNGRGIDREKSDGKNAFGLIGIRERLRAFDGELTIGDRTGGGTVLCVSVPDGRADE